MTKHSFSVPDMTCGHCTAAIKKEISAADTSAQVDCDLGTRTVAVTTSLDHAALIAAFKTAGFDVTTA